MAFAVQKMQTDNEREHKHTHKYEQKYAYIGSKMPLIIVQARFDWNSFL